MNKLLHKIGSIVKDGFLWGTTGFIVPAALLLCTSARIEAVPVFDRNVEFEFSSIGNSAALANSFMNNSILYRYPWWVSTGVKDASNVEWIAAQDFRYSAIEKVLYNFLGGSYEPGSVGAPFRPDFEYVVVVPVEETEDAGNADISAHFNKAFYSSDINKGVTFPSETFINDSIYAYQQEAARFNINAVPEPSSILIFSVMSFGYLWMKNRSS